MNQELRADHPLARRRTNGPLLFGVVLIAAGLMIVWRSFEGPGACRRPQER